MVKHNSNHLTIFPYYYVYTYFILLFYFFPPEDCLVVSGFSSPFSEQFTWSPHVVVPFLGRSQSSLTSPPPASRFLFFSRESSQLEAIITTATLSLSCSHFSNSSPSNSRRRHHGSSSASIQLNSSMPLHLINHYSCFLCSNQITEPIHDCPDDAAHWSSIHNPPWLQSSLSSPRTIVVLPPQTTIELKPMKLLHIFKQVSAYLCLDFIPSQTPHL